MDAHVILRKTDKGRDEIANRTFRLGPRERSLLIVVDGQSTADQLRGKLPHVANSGAILDLLLQEGFVEVAESLAPPAPASAPGAPEPQSLLDAASFGRRFVLDALGPGGDSLAEKLETCRTWPELLPTLEKCREVLQSAAGRRKADQFWAGLAPFLP